VDCSRAMESCDIDDSMTKSVLVPKTRVCGINFSSRMNFLLIFFLEIFANHFLVCMFNESAGLSSSRQDNYIDLGQPKSVAPGPGCSEPD